MAIKRRSTPSSADVAEFTRQGESSQPAGVTDVDVSAVAATEEKTPRLPRKRSDVTPKAENTATGNVSRQMLMRFPSDDIPLALERLAAQDDRSKHYMALKAIQLGLDQLTKGTTH